MKNLANKFALLQFTLFYLISCPGISQNKVNVHIGYGFPELLNFGLRYQLPQVQLGVGYGILGEFQSLSCEVYAHFGGQSEFVERRPWYFRSGVITLKEILDARTTRCTLFPVRVGRDLNISEKAGFQIDLGLAILLSEKIIKENPKYAGFYGDQSGWWPITPCFALSFYYRL